MSLPFESASGDIDLKSLAGYAVLAHIGGCYPAMETKHGAKAVLQTNLVVITGPQAGTEILDKRIFNVRVVRSLRGKIGGAELGHIEIDNSTGNAAIVWTKPDPNEFEAATKWVADNPGRCEELVAMAVAAYDAASQDMGKPRVQQRQAFTPPAQANERPSDPPPFTSSTEDEPPF